MPLFRTRTKRTRGSSMFDIPLEDYDPKTRLPRSLKIGELSVSPFVNVQDVQDYLVILQAFHEVQSRPHFPQIAQQSALQYQIWAQVMLPYYRDRLVERAKGIPPRYPSPKRRRLSLSMDLGAANITEQDFTTSPKSMYGDLELPEPISTPTERSFSTSTNETAHTSHSASTEATLVGDDEGKECVEEAQFLPPLNVLMAWHAHVLQPYKYAHEVDHAYSTLANYPFPLREAAQAIRDGTLPDELDVYGPYTDRYLESTIMDPLDIAAAMYHNANVIEAVDNGGWFRPADFDGRIKAIQNSILRYHAWLDIVRAAGGTSSLMSSVDIDLVWRIHQLDTFRYIEQVESSTGLALAGPRNERHNDGIAKKTSKLWKSIYGTPF